MFICGIYVCCAWMLTAAGTAAGSVLTGTGEALRPPYTVKKTSSQLPYDKTVGERRKTLKMHFADRRGQGCYLCSF